ncbi:MAG TPA: hypothetical protein ENH82_17965 [bacterium]|nr:hypothetical protein [bacterium]
MNLADEKKVSLMCYAPPIDELLKIDSELIFVIDPRYVVSPEHAPGLKSFEFKKWLNSPYLVLTGDKYTPNEVIRMVAEKEGGVLYDNALPEKLIKLKGIIYSEKYNETEKLLAQVSIVVIHFGELLLYENKN